MASKEPHGNQARTVFLRTMSDSRRQFFHASFGQTFTVMSRWSFASDEVDGAMYEKMFPLVR